MATNSFNYAFRPFGQFLKRLHPNFRPIRPTGREGTADGTSCENQNMESHALKVHKKERTNPAVCGFQVSVALALRCSDAVPPASALGHGQGKRAYSSLMARRRGIKE